MWGKTDTGRWVESRPGEWVRRVRRLQAMMGFELGMEVVLHVHWDDHVGQWRAWSRIRISDRSVDHCGPEMLPDLEQAQAAAERLAIEGLRLLERVVGEVSTEMASE